MKAHVLAQSYQKPEHVMWTWLLRGTESGYLSSCPTDQCRVARHCSMFVSYATSASLNGWVLVLAKTWSWTWPEAEASMSSHITRVHTPETPYWTSSLEAYQVKSRYSSAQCCNFVFTWKMHRTMLPVVTVHESPDAENDMWTSHDLFYRLKAKGSDPCTDEDYMLGYGILVC